MKFYEFVEKLQKEYSGKIILIKNGTFFNAIGKDAIVLENVTGIKRTCFAKGICKCGFPVYYYEQNLDKFKQRLQETKMSVIVFDEKKDGKYVYKDRKYDILFEIKGKTINETRKNLNCLECGDNKYYI